MVSFKLLLFLLAFFYAFAGCGQEPQWRYIPAVDTHVVPLGDTTITLLNYRYNNSDTPFFVHLHHNEQTADSALHQYLGQYGGTAIGLQNSRQRLVSFSLKEKRFLFDPNRIFTESGIRQSLQRLSSYNVPAAKEVGSLARKVLSLLPDSLTVIAMHNNTDGAYSLLSYAAGGEYAGEAKTIFRDPKMDEDDFVLTTNAALFRALQAAGINAVLQDNTRASDDGSLSYYFGKKERSYVNVEAEHGHFEEQIRMVKAVIAHLASRTHP